MIRIGLVCVLAFTLVALAPTSAQAAGKPKRSAAVNMTQLWPGGVIRYEFDPTITDPEPILQRMKIWSDHTVIRFVPRSTETDFVRFTQPTDAMVCRSSGIGRTGGMQTLYGSASCGPRTLSHELGHVIGLYHEHSRPDRGSYVKVLYENVERSSLGAFDSTDEMGVSDVYDFGSIMHYPATDFRKAVQPTMETIPPGIPLGTDDKPSAVDYDTVNWLYGAVPERITISANPQGATVIVDGQPYKTPIAFDWRRGEAHVLSVEAQSSASARYEFGRWSDNEPQTHTIIAGDTTVYVANMIRYLPLGRVGVEPPGAGWVEADPPSPDGYYREGTVVRLTAHANAGYSFAYWNGPNTGVVAGSQRATNPWPVVAGISLFQLRAEFTKSQPTVIDSNLPQSRGLVLVDGVEYHAPVAFVWAPGEVHEVEAVAGYVDGATAQRVFARWSDGASRKRTITAGVGNRRYLIEYRSRYLLGPKLSPAEGGELLFDPPSPNGFYDEGTTVKVTARPAAGYRFSNWIGDLKGANEVRILKVDQFRTITAVFARDGAIGDIGSPATLESNPLVAGSRAVAWTPGMGPATASAAPQSADGGFPTQYAGFRVLVNRVAAPVVMAGPGVVSFIVPESVAGQEAASIAVEFGGKLTPARDWVVSPGAPTLYLQDGAEGHSALAFNEAGALNATQSPATRGSVLMLIATGVGALDPSQYEVRIGGITAEILDAFVPTELPGVAAVRVVVPPSVPPGEVSVVMTAYGVVSQLDTTVVVK